MEIEGKIILKLPALSGTSKAGNPWSKQEYVLETVENYPKKVYFDFFGDKAQQYNFEVGDFIRLSFDIESREYNGRWYTSIRGWSGVKIDAPTMGQPQQPPVAAAAPAQSVGIAPSDAAPAPPAENLAGGNDDLPF